VPSPHLDSSVDIPVPGGPSSHKFDAPHLPWPEPGEVVLSVDGLTRELGTLVKTPVLLGIDLAIRAREFVSLTGFSGSGKSTLLYLLGALDRPTSGRVIFEGADISTLDDDERAELRSNAFGFVFQFHFLLPEFTVLENVMIPMLRRGRGHGPRRRIMPCPCWSRLASSPTWSGGPRSCPAASSSA
jgi:ABC-type branched-subunit amino acid transport system ATPase component